jgi:hypothetical protein
MTADKFGREYAKPGEAEDASKGHQSSVQRAHGDAQNGEERMNTVTMPGIGDSETWTPCAGHPHDPRTPEMSVEMSDAHEVCAEVRLWLDLAERGLHRGDLSQFLAAMETARRYLDSMDFSGLPS